MRDTIPDGNFLIARSCGISGKVKIMYRTETHLHTSEVSACASASGREQAEQYKSLGYDTIIVTDHFYNGNTAVDRSLSWDKWVDGFCLGYEHTKARGDEIGLNVLFGLEYGWNGSDFLTYGIDKQWLKDNGDIINISVQEFCDRVHKHGGIIVQAHPFRKADYISEIKLLPEYTDGVEVRNAGNKEKIYDDRALWYAEQFGLTKPAGSDRHHIGGDKFYGVLAGYEIKDISDYIRAVKENDIAELYISP